MQPRYFAHTFDNGNNYCVLDGKNKIVSKYTDLEYGQAHRLAKEMNDEAEASEIQEAAE